MISVEEPTTGLVANQRLLSIESSPSDERKQLIAQRLSHGVCEPAIIINDGPAFIAAVSCAQLNCCIYLEFSLTMSSFLKDNYQARKGSPLLAVNTYLEDSEVAPDIKGGLDTNAFTNVHPIIAETLSGDPIAVRELIAKLGPDSYDSLRNRLIDSTAQNPLHLRLGSPHLSEKTYDTTNKPACPHQNEEPGLELEDKTVTKNNTSPEVSTSSFDAFEKPITKKTTKSNKTFMKKIAIGLFILAFIISGVTLPLLLRGNTSFAEKISLEDYLEPTVVFDNAIDKYLHESSEVEESIRQNTVRKMFLDHEGPVDFHEQDPVSIFTLLPEVTVMTAIEVGYYEGEKYPNGKEEMKDIILKWRTRCFLSTLVKMRLIEGYNKTYKTRLKVPSLENEYINSLTNTLTTYDQLCANEPIFKEFCKQLFINKDDKKSLATGNYGAGNMRSEFVEILSLAKRHQWTILRKQAKKLEQQIKSGNYNDDLVFKLSFPSVAEVTEIFIKLQ